MDGTDPVANYRAIREELALYDPELAARPEIPVVSKSELPGSEAVREALARETGGPVLAISSATGAGLDQLIHAVAAALDRGGEAA
jgi:GTP-binding protein